MSLLAFAVAAVCGSAVQCAVAAVPQKGHHRRGSVQRIAIDALGLAPCLPAGVAHCALSRSQQSQAVCEEGS